ncbi:MAG: hypothetical protein NTV39_00625 [Candidatus Saccharibacteria bacterium]|nr:hypothetical protein [Candidatus Saccharibacteria bacterium]
MEDKIVETAVEAKSFIHKHNFLVFITLSLLISAVVVYVSMQMYNSSGAAQLDLSRPGYVSVRSQVDTSDNDFPTYPANGEMNKGAIDDFRALFKKQAQKIEAVDAFGGSPLDPTALGISDTSTQ